jgi:hypothetical protein
LDGSAKAPADTEQENPRGTLKLSGPLAFALSNLKALIRHRLRRRCRPGSAPTSLTRAPTFREMPHATRKHMPHCNKSAKRPLLKGQWHFGRLLCIGAANIQGRSAACARFGNSGGRKHA